jgi:hypothetical protein
MYRKALQEQLYFLEGGILIKPSSNFIEHWALPNGSIPMDPIQRIETNVPPCSPPFQSIYMRDELWANHMG